MMKTTSLLSSVALVAMTASAFAADLPSRRAPVVIPPPLPIFSWDGVYAGGQIGYAFGRDTAVVTAPAGLFPYSNSLSGVIGGAHIGYNQMLPAGYGFGIGSGLVVGIEGDINGLDFRKTEDLGAAFGAATAGAFPNVVKSTIQGSIRGRFGIAVDRALFFATGGVAFGTFTDSFSSPLGVAIGLPSSFSHTKSGYTVGGGVEYAITPNWSLRAEYRYTDFGKFSDPLLFLASLPDTHRLIQNTVQVGFSYRFATPVAPVVARY